MPDRNPLLLEIGDRLERLGVCDAAVDAYRKGGDAKRAIDCCIRLNEWEMAVELGAMEDYPQLHSLLSQQVHRLLKTEQTVPAIRLYRHAGYHLEASKLVLDIAKKWDLKQASTPRVYSLASTMPIGWTAAPQEASRFERP